MFNVRNCCVVRRVSGEETRKKSKRTKEEEGGVDFVMFLSTRKNVLLITNRMFQNVMDAKKRDYHTVCVCT